MTGKEMAQYCLDKVGTPYFYGCKMTKLTEQIMSTMHKLYPSTVTEAYINKARSYGMVGKVCVDCSGLIGAYRGKQIGSAQLYSSASKILDMKDIQDFPIGTVLYKKGHVGVLVSFDGANKVPMCVEAKGISYGTVKTKVSSTKWTAGLLFSDIEYDTNPGEEVKKSNPYPKPTRTIKKGCQGNDVRWLQYELQEAGYTLEVDGIAGSVTDRCIRSFQASAKLVVDGLAGAKTINALLMD